MEVFERRKELEALGAGLLLVAYDEPSLLATKMMSGLPLDGLVFDPEKESYRNWGLQRAGPFQAMLSPSLNWRYLKLLLRGERFLGFAPDMFQLGGDFVVDPNGNLAFGHAMQDNGDRVAVTRLFSELKTVAGQNPA